MKKLILIISLFVISLIASAENKTITVKNGEEFLKALGPDRTIIIASSKPINITEVLDKHSDVDVVKGDTYYNFQSDDTDDRARTSNFVLTYASNFDGNGLQVRNCPNLTIKSKKGMSTLLASPRYVNVMEFINCDNLTLDHVIMGHTEGGYCDKGVIEIDGSNNVHINDCDFFGCGTEGFVFTDCNNVYVNRSCVHDCTYHTMHISGCNTVRFNDCTFRNNEEFNQINIFGSDNVTFTGCVFDELHGPLFEMDTYQHFCGCVFRNCSLEPVTSSFETHEYSIFRHCTTMYGDTPVGKHVVKKPKFKKGKWTDGKTTYYATIDDAYQITLRGEDGKGFVVKCMNADTNEYETASAFGLENPIGIMGAELAEEGGNSFIRILDDGQELIQSLFYVGQ